MRKQLAYVLGAQQIFLELDEDLPDYDELVEIMSNGQLNTQFLVLGREVGSKVNCIHVCWGGVTFHQISFHLTPRCRSRFLGL